mgnify:CR=1 FL=1
MQEYPIEGAGSQSDIKFIIVEKRFVQVLDDRMINIIFSKGEKQAPCDQWGQNVEEKVEEDDLFFVWHCGLVTGDVDNFNIVEVKMYGIAAIATTRDLHSVVDGI